MIKAIFFDWMRTLADVGELHPADHILNEKEHKELLTKSLNRAKIPTHKKREVRKILRNVFDIKLYPDSERIINSLKTKYKLAVVSNMYPITNRLVRKSFPDFLKKFDIVSLSTEIGFSKPDKDIFLHTLNRLNSKLKTDIRPHEVLFIGDNMEHDIEPALEIGMKAKLINRKKEKLKNILGGLL